MKRMLLIFILLYGLTYTLFGQDEMNLGKAIQLALENNYGVKISDTAIRIAENNNTWARAGKGPTVDLNGSLGNTLIDDNNPASFLNGTYNG